MRYLALGAVMLGLTTPPDMARSETTVHHWPDHPMADAAGYVLWDDDATASPEAPVLPGSSTRARPVLPPDMPGWPVQVSERRGRDGGLWVQADLDPEPEILIQSGYDFMIVHLLDLDGTELPGWPIEIPTGQFSLWGASFGDIDGDGEGEIVAVSDSGPNGRSGWTHAWHTDGTPVAGFPALTFGDHMSCPTVVDLDGDDRAEIIVGEREWPAGKLYVFDGSGQVRSGWPVALDHVPASSAGAADIDDDGIREVFYQSYASLYGLRADGTNLPGFPFTPLNGDVFSYSSPTFADVDADGRLEIAFGAHHGTPRRGTMYLMETDATMLPGWPTETEFWIYGAPTFADIDGDGDLEIIVGDTLLGPPWNKTYAWHVDGSLVNGWPVGPHYAVNAQVAVADMDGDGDAELVWDDNTQFSDGTGRLLGYHHDGTPLAGWPLHTEGSPFMNNVAFADVDLNGDIEMLVIAGDLQAPPTTFYLWDLPGSGPPSSIQMPMYQYGPGRDGVATPLVTVAIPPSQSPDTSPTLRVDMNPVRTGVVVSFSVATSGHVRLTVHDPQGRLIRRLLDERRGPGSAEVSWDRRDRDGQPVSAGVYLVRLETREGVGGRKVVLLD